MRLGEVLISTPTPNGPAKHLVIDDVAVDSHTDPRIVHIRLRIPKTDQHGPGVNIYFGHTIADLCPMSVLLSYLVIRGNAPGPLFQSEEGRPLTKAAFVSRIQQILSVSGMQANLYKGHSFRIGAAIMAAANGVPDHLIKVLGWWASSCYQLYIRTPPGRFTSISQLPQH